MRNAPLNQRTLLFALLAAYLATTPSPAQLRVLERNKPGLGLTSPSGFYDRARHVVVASDRDRTIEWDGKGMTTPPSPPGTGVRASCPFPGDPSSGLAFDENGTRRYRSGVWQSVPAANQPPRLASARYALALDTSRQRAVLACDSPPSYFEFDGSSWSSIPARSFPEAMAFDESRGRMLIVSNTHYSEWNGTAWNDYGGMLFGGGPHALCYDKTRGVMVLLASYGLLFEGNWLSMTQRNVTAPGLVRYTAFVYDESRGRCVLLGGVNPFANNQDEVWTYDGSSFRSEVGDGARPFATNDAMLAHDGATGSILFGGRDANNVPMGTTFRFDGSTWQDLTAAGGPPPRSAAAMTRLDSQQVLLFGGLDSNGTALGDAWIYSSAFSWNRLLATRWPPARLNHALASDRNDNYRAYLFGGQDSNGVKLNDLWRLEAATLGMRWSPLTTSTRPSARDIHAMAFDDQRRRLVLFGGRDASNTFLNDTWEFDPLTTSWTQLQPARSPGARVNAAMVFDAGRNRIVLIGGYDGSYLNEIWEFDGRTWTPRQPETPAFTATENPAAAYDPTTQRIVMFGGQVPTSPVSDSTYELSWDTDLAELTQQNATPLRIEGRPTSRPYGLVRLNLPLRVRFDSPLGLAALWITAGPSTTPVLALTPPLVCQPSSLYLLPLISVPFFQEVSLILPSTLIDQTLSMQGVLYDSPGCWRVTEAWLVRMRG